MSKNKKPSLFERLSVLHEMIAPSDEPPYAGGTAVLTANELKKLLDVVEAAKIHLEAQMNGTYDVALHVALDEVYKK